MSEREWIFWGITESLKNFLVTYGVMGFEVKRNNYKYLVFLYLIIGIPVMEYLNPDILLYKTVWGVLLIYFFFIGNRMKKIQLFLIEYFSIAIVDVFFWMIYINIADVTPEKAMISGVEISSCLGIIFWMAISFILHKNNNKYFVELPVGWYLLVAVALVGMSLMVGFVQECFMDGIEAINLKYLLMIILLVLFLNIVIYIYFMYLIYSKKRMELLCFINKEHLNYQREYYSKMIRQDEEIKAFRHDIKKLMNGLNCLAEKDDLTGLKAFIENMDGKFQQISVIKTGNEIADCFINGTIYEIQKKGKLEYSVMGRFPMSIRIDDTDLCVLLANALDNAREELEQIRGKKILNISIKSYNDRLFINISNSCRPKKGSLLQSSKKSIAEHGYGTKNMKQIVEKYHGTIEWNWYDDMFEVSIKV